MLFFYAASLTPGHVARGDEISKGNFKPDPLSVQRCGTGYRYPQAGWVVLHIEGEPYERGYQHGRLMAPEIAAYVRAFASDRSSTAPGDAWKITRTLVNALFLRRFDREYLQEMKGIADGAAAAGARFEGRPIDLIDIAAINTQELETLDSALEALPTGLEGIRFPHTQPRAMPAPKPMHCSAFAATGPATADGKIVLGHITMGSLLWAYHYNLWIDLKPAKGHRVLMQSYPGGIQSGLDYYMNDAGLLITETTITQTKYDIRGMTLASRIRQAIQYADSIDRAVEIMKTRNNGLYTNEWLLADVKTNEIAMFEMGTTKSKLYRSGRNEWVGGTEGFYWGCNNTKDRDVRLETFAGLNDRPENSCFCPSDRDKVWVRLYQQHRGKIDTRFGKVAFTTPPIAAHSSWDAKFTTTDLAKDLKTWAHFGPPLGRSWKPTFEERKRYPDIHPLASNSWTILHSTAPEHIPGTRLASDLPDPNQGSFESVDTKEEVKPGITKPAWHGTVLPKTEADIWLAAAFAAYERIVAAENDAKESPEGKSTSLARVDRERLAVEINSYRSRYLASARAGRDVPLAETRSEFGSSHWYNVTVGKGVLVLQELAHTLGDSRFNEVMDSFGRQHAGQEVTVGEFQAHVERAAGKPMRDFFEYWLHRPGLPQVRLEKISAASRDKRFEIKGEILRERGVPATQIEFVVETEQGEEVKTISASAGRTAFAIQTKHKPMRLVADRYVGSAKAGGGAYSVLSWHDELENTLIIYGTLDEEAANKEAAEALQESVVCRHSNFTLPIRADRDISQDDLSTHHLLLIGRPDCNSVVERLKKATPIAFGPRSFSIGNDSYAHARSAIVAAGENPVNPRYSIVVIAGLCAESTVQASVQLLDKATLGTEVLILPGTGKPRSLVVPPSELVKDFRNDDASTSRQARRDD
jgi:hypothetical protein